MLKEQQFSKLKLIVSQRLAFIWFLAILIIYKYLVLNNIWLDLYRTTILLEHFLADLFIRKCFHIKSNIYI